VAAALLFHQPLAVAGIALLLLIGLSAISSGPKVRWRATAKLAVVGIIAFGVSYGANLILSSLGL